MFSAWSQRLSIRLAVMRTSNQIWILCSHSVWLRLQSIVQDTGAARIPGSDQYLPARSSLLDFVSPRIWPRVSPILEWTAGSMWEALVGQVKYAGYESMTSLSLVTLDGVGCLVQVIFLNILMCSLRGHPIQHSYPDGVNCGRTT